MTLPEWRAIFSANYSIRAFLFFFNIFENNVLLGMKLLHENVLFSFFNDFLKIISILQLPFWSNGQPSFPNSIPQVFLVLPTEQVNSTVFNKKTCNLSLIDLQFLIKNSKNWLFPCSAGGTFVKNVPFLVFRTKRIFASFFLLTTEHETKKLSFSIFWLPSFLQILDQNFVIAQVGMKHSIFFCPKSDARFLSKIDQNMSPTIKTKKLVHIIISSQAIIFPPLCSAGPIRKLPQCYL